jgi:very-short-patch-repair endonuclease
LLATRGADAVSSRHPAAAVVADVSERDLLRLAASQHSLVTIGQARTLLTEGQVRHRIRAGRLEPVRTGVLRVAGSRNTWEQQVLAAVLAGGPGTLASFRTAATLWSLEGLRRRDRVEITVRSERRARLPGITVHDSMIMPAHHVARRDGIPVTSVARTLCDLTACCSASIVGRAIDDGLRRRLVTLHQLERAYHDLAHRGRRRSRTMRGLLEQRLAVPDSGDSDPEVTLYRWIAEAGLPVPVMQHRVAIGARTYHIDLAYPDLKIGIEYDGFDWHRPRSAFDADRARQNLLEIHHWLVLRYTSAATSSDVVGEVTEAITARTHVPPPP